MPRSPQVLDHGRRGAVRVGDEGGVGALGHVVGVVGLELAPHAVARVDVVEPAAGVGARRDHRQLEPRVPLDDGGRQRTGEPGGSEHGDPRHAGPRRCSRQRVFDRGSRAPPPPRR